MTINIFVLKGDLNGKIVVVRFFFLLGIDTMADFGGYILSTVIISADKYIFSEK